MKSGIDPRDEALADKIHEAHDDYHRLVCQEDNDRLQEHLHAKIIRIIAKARYEGVMEGIKQAAAGFEGLFD